MIRRDEDRLIASVELYTVNGTLHWPMMLDTSDVQVALLAILRYIETRYGSLPGVTISICITHLDGSTVYNECINAPRPLYNN